MFVFLLSLALDAHAYVYATPEQVVARWLPSGAEAIAWAPDVAAREKLKGLLGYDVARADWTLHRGAEGVVVFDQQLGQHEPIDFGVLVDPQGVVRQVDVLVYREAYGDGVRGEAFRRQFFGRGVADPMRPGKEIRVVSGATISTRAMATGVRRALAVVSVYRAEQ